MLPKSRENGVQKYAVEAANNILTTRVMQFFLANYPRIPEKFLNSANEEKKEEEKKVKRMINAALRLASFLIFPWSDILLVHPSI